MAYYSVCCVVCLRVHSLQELSYKQYADSAEACNGLQEVASTEWVPNDLRQVGVQLPLLGCSTATFTLLLQLPPYLIGVYGSSALLRESLLSNQRKFQGICCVF
jgi:hypothetical protein